MSSYQPNAPVEDVNRGTVVALLAIPVGVVVFVVVWTIGIVASIITFGVAYLAMFLYRLGSGGGISRAGAIRVTIITLVTLALSIFAGLVSDVAIGVGRMSGSSPVEAILDPGFWTIFEQTLAGADSGIWLSVGLAALFGVIGCFGILRSAFAAEAQPAPAAAQWSAPAAPQYGAYPPAPENFQGSSAQQFLSQFPDPGQTGPAQAAPAATPGQQAQPADGQEIPGVPQFPSQLQNPTGQVPQQPAPPSPWPGTQPPTEQR